MQVRSTDWTQTLNPVGTRRWLGRSEATSRPVGLRIGSSSISSWCQAWTVVLFLPSPVCARAGGGLHRSAVPPALLGSARAVCACWCAAAAATVTVTVGLAIMTSSAAPVTAGATSRCHERHCVCGARPCAGGRGRVFLRLRLGTIGPAPDGETRERLAGVRGAGA